MGEAQSPFIKGFTSIVISSSMIFGDRRFGKPPLITELPGFVSKRPQTLTRLVWELR